MPSSLNIIRDSSELQYCLLWISPVLLENAGPQRMWSQSPPRGARFCGATATALSARPLARRGVAAPQHRNPASAATDGTIVELGNSVVRHEAPQTLVSP
jgi:hypothetical protein